MVRKVTERSGNLLRVLLLNGCTCLIAPIKSNKGKGHFTFLHVGRSPLLVNWWHTDAQAVLLPDSTRMLLILCEEKK